MLVKKSYQARWYLSRNLEDMRQCEGKDIPGTFKRKSQVQRPWGGARVGPEQSRQQVELWEINTGSQMEAGHGRCEGPVAFSLMERVPLQGSEQGRA